MTINALLKRAILNFQVLLVLVVSIHLSFEAKAAHIVGGDAIYKCLNVDSTNQQTTLLFEFTLYRDLFSGGADPDTDAQFGVYRELSDGTWESIGELRDVTYTDRSDIPLNENPCIETPPNIGVEKAVYRFEYTFDWYRSNYMVAYQRCCRNSTIANIINPGDTGAAIAIEIFPEALSSCNNTPEFNQFPPIFICSGIDIDFDHSASDVEGDEIRYSFCAPLAAGGTDGSQPGTGSQFSCTGVRPDATMCLPPFDNVIYNQPFFDAQPLMGDPIVTMNSNTGLISGIPNIVGQFVVGVCATEYRDGQIISVIQRDFQFNVTSCIINVNANVLADVSVGNQNYIINSCGETEVKMNNLSTIEANINSYKWEFDTTGDGIFDDTRTSRDATFTFNGINTYEGIMVLNESSPACSDTAFLTVNLFPAIDANFNFDYDTCVAGPVEFIDSSFTGADRIEAWDWDFDDGEADFVENPSHTFSTPGDKNVSLIVTDNNECKDTMMKVIEYYPAPPILIVEPNNFVGCTPGQIFFNNLSEPIDSTYDITWTFGDGMTGDAVSPTHVYEDPGVYTITLDVVSPLGCQKDIVFPNWIRIQESPVADFICDNENADEYNNTVNFTDQSTGAERYQWEFADLGTSLEQNPTFEFIDTGSYEVRLTVIHESGCPDTMTKIIDVAPVTTFFFPNAFTPNGDGNNDFFLGRGIIKGSSEFEMSIWNRWGERLFQTNDYREGWDGTTNNTGNPLPQGVYVYTYRLVAPRGEIFEGNGAVTLIR